ncbi:MAG TPA: amino acid permease [Allosphingosinicella sp.]|jgi:APA family basic amino acid/polyamine antiporter|nr:amino acid permease [Allosphingosinicella sp.]
MGEAKDSRIGIWMTGALVVGTMIGSGIFLLPVSLAPLGANAMVGWILSSAGAIAIAFALARLSTLGGEGIQANIERQLGRHVAFLVAWSFWVSNWAAGAAVAIAGASALSWISPAFAGPGFVIPVAVGSVVVFTAVNALGVRASGATSIVTVAIRLLPLVGVILILALRGIGSARYEPLAPAALTFGNLATATALTFFALTGFENATTPVDKVRDPVRTIPRAILGGTFFVAILYLLASTGVQLLLPARIVAVSPAPFADVIAAQWGGGAASFVAFTIAIAAFGCLNALILAAGELGYAMALRRDLPAAMARTWRGNTPVIAQIAGSVLAVLLILANSSRASASLFTFVILLSTAAVLVVYLAGALAAWRLSASLPARAAIVVALLFILFAFYGTGAEASLWGLVLLAIGLAVRAIMHRLPSPDVGAAPVAMAAPLE